MPHALSSVESGAEYRAAVVEDALRERGEGAAGGGIAADGGIRNPSGVDGGRRTRFHGMENRTDRGTASATDTALGIHDGKWESFGIAAHGNGVTVADVRAGGAAGAALMGRQTRRGPFGTVRFDGATGVLAIASGAGRVVRG